MQLMLIQLHLVPQIHTIMVMAMLVVLYLMMMEPKCLYLMQAIDIYINKIFQLPLMYQVQQVLLLVFIQVPVFIRIPYHLIMMEQNYLY